MRAFEDVCIGKDMGNKCLRKPTLVERWKTSSQRGNGESPYGRLWDQKPRQRQHERWGGCKCKVDSLEPAHWLWEIIEEKYTGII